MQELSTTAKISFTNDNDFIDGVREMEEMLSKWISTADEGTERSYVITPKSADRTLEINLTVKK